MHLKNSRIIVIKIGSSLLVDEKRRIRKKWLNNFAKDIIKNSKVDLIMINDEKELAKYVKKNIYFNYS